MSYSASRTQDSDDFDEVIVEIFSVRGVVDEMIRISADRADYLLYRAESSSNAFRVIELY